MFDLFSLIGEAIDPGPVGSIEAAAPEVKSRPRAVIITHFAFAAGLFIAVLILLCQWCWGHWGWLAVSLMLFTGYLLAAHYLSPSPDYDNMGWLGGLFNNPFRYSDDLNWFLLLLKILLWPGAFMMLGLRDGVLLMMGRIPKKRRKKKKRPKVEVESRSIP